MAAKQRIDDMSEEIDGQFNDQKAQGTEETSAADELQEAQVQGYDARLRELYSQIGARPSFSYDPEDDMLYGQYKAHYTDQGRRAMMDSMGQASALTGGYGSSYASAVGQQQYNSYMQQLNALLPELYSAAAEQYSRDTNELYKQYDLNSNAQAQAYETVLYMINATGYSPTEQEMTDSGLSPEQVKQLRIKYYTDNGLPLPVDLGGSVSAGGGGGHGFDYFMGDGGTEYNPYGYKNADGKSQVEVQRIQEELGVAADGIWGPNTERAYNNKHS